MFIYYQMSKVSGVILAGGKSSRMGQDKGMMYFKGQPMVSWVIQCMKEITPYISISTNDHSYIKWGLPMIEDHEKEQGPLAGLISSLSQVSYEDVLVLSCDMPFVEPFVLQRLLDESEGAEIVVPKIEGRVYPLCAYYKRSCLPKLKMLFEQGERRMQDVIKQFNCQEVSFSASYEHYFKNINTPREKELFEL